MRESERNGINWKGDRAEVIIDIIQAVEHERGVYNPTLWIHRSS